MDNNKIKEPINIIINNNAKLSEEITKIKKINKLIKIKFISLILALGLGTGLGIGVSKLVKKLTTIKVYPTKTITNEGETREGYIEIKEHPEDKIVIKEYSPILPIENGNKKNLVRTVKTYDVTEYQLDKLDDYLKIDLTDKLPEEKAYYIDNQKTNPESYLIVEKTTVIKQEEERNTKFYEQDKEAIYAIYILLLLFIPKVGIINILKSINKNNTEKENIKLNCLDCLSIIENNLSKIKEMLKKNPELAKEFIILYEENLAIKNNLPKILENIEGLLSKDFEYQDVINIARSYVRTKRKQVETL